MLSILKRFASRLPHSVQQELRRHWVSFRFRGDYTNVMEAEFALLPRFVKPGDWALDIGANVGSYSKRLAALVQPEGHVIAVEPIVDSAEILMSFARQAGNMTV